MVNSVKQGERKIGWESVILLASLCVIFIVPYFTRNVSVVIVLAIMALYVVSIASFFFTMESWKTNTVYTICLFIAMEAVYKVLRISSATVDYYFATIKFLFLLCAVLPVIRHLSKKQKWVLLLVCVITMTYTMIDNIILSQDYTANYFATLAVRPEGEKTNAPDTAFSTAAMLFSGTAVCWVSGVRKKWYRFAGLILALLAFYFLLTAGQRGIVFILTLVMLALFCTNTKKNVRNSWFWNAVGIVLVLVFFISGIYKTLLYWIVDTLGAERLHERVDSIVMLLESRNIDAMDGSMVKRMQLILRSLQTATSSFGRFLFGVGDHRDSVELIGNHSQFIDMIARYGICGIAIFVLMLSCVYKAVLRMSEVQNSRWLMQRIKVLLFVVTLRGLLGNVMIGSIGVQLFVLIPIGFSFIAAQEGISNA